LLTGRECRITCIDTFAGSMEDGYDGAGLLDRFWENTAGHEDRVRAIVGESQGALIKLAAAGETFDFVYVDGSHLAKDVLSDAILAWAMLREGGVMVLDDYQWDRYREPHLNPRAAVDSFMRTHRQEFVPIHVGYQVMLRKQPVHIPAHASLRIKMHGLEVSTRAFAKHLFGRP
jgi:hypothetical protein